MSVKKYSNAFFTEQAIKEYEKKNAPVREERDYDKESTNKYLSEAVYASIKRNNNNMNRSKFLKEAKDWLLGECIYKIYNESLSSILSEKENSMISDGVKHAMIYNFIEEAGGTDKLLRKFYDQNVLLSEIYNCVNHYYDLIVEATKKKECCDANDFYKIPSDVQDDFYKELDTADFGDVTIQISNRVVDAIDKFITDNNDNMNNIKNILATTKENIASAKTTTAESALEESAKKKISAIKQNRRMNVFGAMMEQTAKSVMKNDELREQFIDNGSLDVAKLKAYCAASYTMLETINTANLMPIDSEYIMNIIESI